MLKKITILLFVGLSFIYAEGDLNLINGLTDIVDQAEDKKVEDKKVLNYAFQQRMRTQWIARDALLIENDFNRSFYQKEILDNANAFDKNLHLLLASTKDIEKAKKRDKNFDKKIKDLNNTWEKFYDCVKKISKNPEDKESLKFISENNLKLLDDIAYIFTNFIKSYNSTDKLEASMAHIKSMLYTQVGKPRLYMNKMVKEKLLIKNNINKEENEKKFKNSIKDMDRLMKALKDGDKGLELTGTEDRKILNQLAISQKLWEEVKQIVTKDKLTNKEWLDLVKKNEKFIEVHTKVVKLTRNATDI